VIINNKEDHSRRIRNILKVYNAATDEEREQGMNWYQAAFTFARGLSERYGVTTHAAAGIIAALSPQTDWDRNLILAETVCRTRKAAKGQTGANNAKALAIVNGGRPADVLGGNKVRAFFDNLVFGNMSHRVTIDRHAYGIAEATLEQPKPSTLSNPTRYGYYEDAYRDAASLLGIHATELQAITWVVWRNRTREERATLQS
jgi:hypothetical protein